MPTNPFTVGAVEAALHGRFVLAAPELRVGGQGVVYKALRKTNPAGIAVGDQVALKLHTDARQDERVEREIEAMKEISHPCLATLLEEGITTLNGVQVRYIVWKFIEGEPLDARLVRGPLTESELAKMGIDVVSAISTLWSKHIVHRDINPKNIIVKSDGRFILIDLGGARHLDHSTITAPGATFGTVGYFSPEQARAEHALTCASDVFTLGVVMLECLGGQHPTNYNQQKLCTVPPSTASIAPHISAPTQQLIDRMLHMRAAFRPSLVELALRLNAIS